MNLTEAIQANMVPMASAAGGFVIGLAIGLLCGRRGCGHKSQFLVFVDKGYFVRTT